MQLGVSSFLYIVVRACEPYLLRTEAKGCEAPQQAKSGFKYVSCKMGKDTVYTLGRENRFGQDMEASVVRDQFFVREK